MHDGLSLHIPLISVPFVCFAFGWSILGRFTRLDDEERFVAAWAVGLGFMGLAEFAAFLTHVPAAWDNISLHPALALALQWFAARVSYTEFNVGVLALMVLLAVLCQIGRLPSFPRSLDFLWLAGLWALGYLYLVCIQALLPQYVGGDWWYDWLMHYEAARIFLGTRGLDYIFPGGYHLSSRTPLFNWVAAFTLSLTGERFPVYQIAASWMNWLWPAALYLVLRDRFGPRVARLALLLAPINLWMLHMAWFTWPKLLAAFFHILGLHFYLTFLRTRASDAGAARQRFTLFWISSLLGIMTHTVGVVYFVPLLAHAAWLVIRARGPWPRVRDAAAWLVTAALLAAPWFLWINAHYGRDTVTKYNPLRVMMPDADHPDMQSQESRLRRMMPGPEEGGSYVVKEWVWTMGQNIVTTLVPLPDSAVRANHEPLARLYMLATNTYFSLLIGAMTWTLLGFLWLMVLPWERRRILAMSPPRAPSSETVALWLFIGFGYLGALALHPSGSMHGLSHNACFTSVIVMVGLAWGLLGCARPQWIALVVAGMLGEFLIMFWSHVSLAALPRVLDPGGANEGFKADAKVDFLYDLASSPLPAAWAVIVLQHALIALFVIWLTIGPRKQSVLDHANGRGNLGNGFRAR
jgi:hypothetical protein